MKRPWKTQDRFPGRGDFEYNETRAIQCSVEVAKAIKSGKLVRPSSCSCGVAPVQAHHFDYGKPLEVWWCCKQCHQRISRFLRFFARWERFLILVNAGKYDGWSLRLPLLKKNGCPRKIKSWEAIWKAVA